MDQELYIDTRIMQADELHQRMETDYIDAVGTINPEDCNIGDCGYDQ